VDEKMTPAEFLSALATEGWPDDVAVILDWMADVRDEYKPVSVSISAYPKLEAPVPEGWQPEGKRHRIELATGQQIWMVVDNEGLLLERGYSDRGDVHFKDVEAVIRRWYKTVRQSGPPTGTKQREQQRIHKRYLAIKRYSSFLTMDEIADELKVSRSHLYAIIKKFEGD
jgi:hypothetical protein